MDLSVKVGILCLVGAILILMAFVAHRGKTLAKPHHLQHRRDTLKAHRGAAEGIGWLIALLIITLEFAAQTREPTYGWLFWAHLPFAAIWVVSFAALLLRHNGLRYRRLHGPLAYSGIASGTIASGIGTYLLMQA